MLKKTSEVEKFFGFGFIFQYLSTKGLFFNSSDNYSYSSTVIFVTCTRQYYTIAHVITVFKISNKSLDVEKFFDVKG